MANEFEPGHPKKGGKKKGFRKNATVEDIAQKLGVNIFDVLCKFAAGDHASLGLRKNGITPTMRLNAARDACKYLYSQKKSVVLSNPDGEGFKIEVVDYSEKK